jgi:xanthosine utilization system XapX-like protein
LFYPFEQFLNNWFIPVMSVSLPVMVIEAIVGSYIGYKIYKRVEKLV